MAAMDFQSEQFYLVFFFVFFFIYKLPRCFLPSFESIGISVQEKKQKINK